MKTCSMPFSVCMSVYRNDNSEDFRLSVESIYYQTVVPDEIVLVVDGPIDKKLDAVIMQLKSSIPILKVFKLSQNMGHGVVRNKAINLAKNELVAIMDSDDIALKDRFEKQLKCFEQDENLSIVGGAITEFIGNPSNIIARRVCPTTDNKIKAYMKSRCGFNQMTVMFKKSDVVRAGNYQHWHYNEDYYLWLRMMLAGCKFANLSDTLVNVRVGKDMYARRGGWRYFKSEAKLQYYMLKNRIINPFRYLYNLVVRFVLQVLMPTQLRGWVFRKFARDNKIG